MERTKDGTRRIVRTPSQTWTVKLTRQELAYFEWLEQKQLAERPDGDALGPDPDAKPAG